MNCFAMVKRVQGLRFCLAATGALAVVFSGGPARAADRKQKDGTGKAIHDIWNADAR